METLFNIVTIAHWGIWIVCTISVLMVLRYGLHARISMFIAASLLVIQGVWNGCPVTSLQNWMLEQFSNRVIENKVLFSYILPSVDTQILRGAMLTIGLIMFALLIYIMEANHE